MGVIQGRQDAIPHGAISLPGHQAPQGLAPDEGVGILSGKPQSTLEQGRPIVIQKGDPKSPQGRQAKLGILMGQQPENLVAKGPPQRHLAAGEKNHQAAGAELR